MSRSKQQLVASQGVSDACRSSQIKMDVMEMTVKKILHSLCACIGRRVPQSQPHLRVHVSFGVN
ncbi:hypothetical protein SORBI_3010G101350 [Sorghum bicolor]|uniref:Uncharacterized protein n=1 Tax=Sorghum bicolor TaxID=4558 RepID=A0A1W0VSC3_SORBI|nr:hypothetical protein SORBI_3010G101350 [Sorghum bicolor]